jgi:hypothetical protein
MAFANHPPVTHSDNTVEDVARSGASEHNKVYKFSRDNVAETNEST